MITHSSGAAVPLWPPDSVRRASYNNNNNNTPVTKSIVYCTNGNLAKIKIWYIKPFLVRNKYI